MGTKTFATWDDLLTHLKTTEVVGYHAPLDISPRTVRAKAFKNGKVRVHAVVTTRGGRGSDGIRFTADSGHLSRFRQLVVKCTLCGQHFDVGDHCGCGFYAERT